MSADSASRQTLGKTLWLLLETVLPAVVALVATPQIVRGLGPDQYGILLMVFSVISMGALADVGLAIVGARELAIGRANGDHHHVHRVLATLLTVYATVGFAAAAGIWLGAPWLTVHVFDLRPELCGPASQVLRWAGVGTMAQFLAGLSMGFFRSAERFDVTARITVATTLLSQVIIVWRARMGDLSGAVIASVTFSLLQPLVMVAIGWRTQRAWLGLQRPSWVLLRGMIRLGAYQFVAAGWYRAGEQAGRLLLTRFFGPAALSYYSVPFSLVQQLQVVVAAPAQLLLPRIATMTAAGQMSEVASTVRVASKLVLWVGVAGFVPLICCSRPLLAAWIGGDFAQAAWMHLSVLGLAGALGALRMVYAYVLYGFGDTRTIMVGEALRASLHTALLLILLPWLGPVGASVAWLGSWVALELFRRRTAQHAAQSGPQGVAALALTTLAVALPLGLLTRFLLGEVGHSAPWVVLVLASSGLTSLACLGLTAAWPRLFGADAPQMRQTALTAFAGLRRRLGA